MQSSVCSDSETSTISQGSFVTQTKKQPQQYDHRTMNDTFVLNSNNSTTTFKQQQYQHQQKPSSEDSEYYNEEELWRLMDVDECGGSAEHPDRPSHLDLAGTSGYTPVISRKPMFQFSGKFTVHISYVLK